MTHKNVLSPVVMTSQYNLKEFGKHCRRNNCMIISKQLCQTMDYQLVLKTLLEYFRIDTSMNGLKCSDTIAKSILYNFYQSQMFDAETLLKITHELVVKYNIGLNERKQRQRNHTNLDVASEQVISHLPAEKFYKSKEWRSIRYIALRTYGNKCFACGRSPADGVQIHVDHVKPRSVFPELSLDMSNLQILCEDCNLGKSNVYSDKWSDKK